MFADRRVVLLLREYYVPVALDVWYEQRREDTPGEFFRSIAAQRPDYDPENTAQGLYVATPRGDLLEYTNHRDPGRLRGALDAAFKKAEKLEGSRGPAPKAAPASDPAFERFPPKGTCVVRVYSRVVEGRWKVEKVGLWDTIRREATGRDLLWILREEVEALRRGEVAPALARRIARFHLIDNTRGEPPMWAADEVAAVSLAAEPEGDTRCVIRGSARLASRDGARSFDAAIYGVAEFSRDGLARFDLVARGAHCGCGRYTGDPPESPFTVAIAFTIARDDEAANVPPAGARMLRDYLAPP